MDVNAAEPMRRIEITDSHLEAPIRRPLLATDNVLRNGEPAAHIVERLRRRGIPATLSRDAGQYICNALLYRTQEIAREADNVPRSGFIHLPADLVNERNPALGPAVGCRLTWRQVVEGGLEIIAATLGQSAPVARTRWLGRTAAARGA